MSCRGPKGPPLSSTIYAAWWPHQLSVNPLQVMDSSEDRQQLEITALKSIYDEDFIECPPPRAWKVRLLSLYRFETWICECVYRGQGPNKGWMDRVLDQITFFRETSSMINLRLGREVSSCVFECERDFCRRCSGLGIRRVLSPTLLTTPSSMNPKRQY